MNQPSDGSYLLTVSLYISPLSVERQEAEPASVKHTGDSDSQQTQGVRR